MFIVGLAGIILGLAFLITAVYKGLTPLIAAPIAAIIVAVTNHLGMVAGYSVNFQNGVGGFVTANFPIYLWGAIFGELYNKTGGAKAIAQAISKQFRRGKENTTPLTAILIVFVAGLVMSYGGISGIVLMFVLMPLVLEIIREARLPRYMAPGILLGSIATAALCMPGSPQMQNSLPQQYLGTSPTAALVPGVIGGIVVLALNVWFLNYSGKKEIAAGRVYQEAEGLPTADVQQNLPGAFISLIPLVVTFILYNVFKLYIAYSMIGGIIACLICFYRYLEDIKNMLKSLSASALSAAFLTLAAGSLAGFGAVVSATSAFTEFSTRLTSIQGAPLLIAMFAICLITGICGSGPAGIGAALPMFQDTFAAMGVQMSALHRIAAFSATTLDTLPTNAGFISATGLAKAETKDSYKYVGVCTVLNTTIATLVVTLLLILFPGLA